MVSPNPASPEVSVIVPARNEEASLPACLQSLTAQQAISFEVILVDDGSTDRTREIAMSFPGVRVVDAPELPANWTGKNNAVAAGAQVARGEWLLFTDADTVHLPGSLRRSLAEARQRKVSLLSYSPEQIVTGFWQRAVMPVIFAELATTYRPSAVSDPKSPAAAANGQYLLVSREAYDAVGGHPGIATELLEDVALARAVKLSGRKIFFRYGSDAVRTRMYRSFDQMREGWTKNLAVLFPSPGQLAILRLAEFAVICGGIATAMILMRLHSPFRATVVGVLAATLYDVLLTRIRKAHFSWPASVLGLFGLPMFAYFLLRSRRSYREGRVGWKGRSYQLPARPAASSAEDASAAKISPIPAATNHSECPR